jgi:hypothetical protein
MILQDFFKNANWLLLPFHLVCQPHFPTETADLLAVFSLCLPTGVPQPTDFLSVL